MRHARRIQGSSRRERARARAPRGLVTGLLLLLLGIPPSGAEADASQGGGDVVVVGDGPVVADVSYPPDPAAERARLVAELARAEDARDHTRPRLGRAIAGLVLDAGLIVGAIYLGRYVEDHACAQLATAEAAGAPVGQSTSACERGTHIGMYSLVGLGAVLGAMNVVRIVLHAVRRARATDAVDAARLRLDEFVRDHPSVGFDLRTDGHGAFGVLLLRF